MCLPLPQGPISRRQRSVDNLPAGAGTRAGARGDAPALADHVDELPDAKRDAGEDDKEDDDDDGDDVVALHHDGGWRAKTAPACVWMWICVVVLVVWW